MNFYTLDYIISHQSADSVLHGEDDARQEQGEHHAHAQDRIGGLVRDDVVKGIEVHASLNLGSDARRI